ncbi:sodium/hydrogen exchanger 9B2-like isoform X1 [Macrosteles quadrilineatus]|uniref:sodium/hydrogen exchanger 9B2-like isoform X1 n=2 Tax=Macrosteles quadrilineatus TaxID=74068 RepID=UPI0023E23B99|nr:sodium/hydrogen exchanger 9B2-like isoform X1 [Macrosteles quadrilineatus]
MSAMLKKFDSQSTCPSFNMYANRAFYIGDEGTQGDSDVPQAPTSQEPNEFSNRTTPPPLKSTGDPGWLSQLFVNQCGCGNTLLVRLLGVVILLMVVWLLLVVLVGREVLPGGGLFNLLVLVLLAQLVGELVELLHLPAILGMLITGIAMRTANLYSVSGVYVNIVSTLREISLGVILIKAGLGLDPVALRKLSFTVIRLAVCPGLVEAVTVAIMTHHFLGYPWLWGFALGFLMCAISPAVVVPTLLKLKKEGYGESKGISTLVIAASSIDDVLAISVFSICLSIIFSTGESLVGQISQGPLDVMVGLTVGAVWGLTSALTPLLEDDYLVWKRVVLIGCGGLSAVLGSSFAGYPGAGPLVAITSAFVASTVWAQQGWAADSNPVENIFSGIWQVMQPVLFALIGAEIDLTLLQPEILTWGLIVIAAALVMRVFACSLVLVGGKLNFKEVVFVNLAWLPKATVQAALAPQALDMARKSVDPSAADLQRGSEFLTIAVLSILITAPLGSIGASVAGPRLLAKTSDTQTQQRNEEDHHL